MKKKLLFIITISLIINSCTKKRTNEMTISDYTKAIEANPNDEIAYHNRGLLKNNTKDYQGAIKDYNKAIEINPNNDFFYYNRGISKGIIKDQ